MQKFTAVLPDASVLSVKGYAHVATLPVILGQGGTRYEPDANEFLYERCLGYWPSRPDGQQPPVTPRSQATYAHALADFLSYAAHRCFDLTEIDYVRHIYGQYQSEMLAGTWSASRRPLSPSTVNARIDRACEFLVWLEQKGRRARFAIPAQDISIHVGIHRSAHAATQVVRSRKGRVPRRRSELQLPTDEQLGLWLAAVERRHGATLCLAFELVLQTAIRKAELIGWRVDTIPRNPLDWIVANPTAAPEDQSILVVIRYGTKGGFFGVVDGDKVGPERTILVPLPLARRIHEYRETTRRRALLGLKSKFKGRELAERMSDSHLFVDERNGLPIDYDRVTNCWRNVDALPFKGWSAHKGRHWWACMKLWRQLKYMEADLKARGDGAGRSLIALATDVMRLEIKEQLGHLDLVTTQRYVRWVARQLSVALPTDYADYMRSSDNGEQEIDDE